MLKCEIETPRTTLTGMCFCAGDRKGPFSLLSEVLRLAEEKEKLEQKSGPVLPTVTPFENFEDMERTLQPFGAVSALRSLNLALYGAGALSNRVMKKQDQEMVFSGCWSLCGAIINRLFGEGSDLRDTVDPQCP